MIKKLILLTTFLSLPLMYCADMMPPAGTTPVAPGAGMPDEEMTYDQLKEWADVLFPDFTDEMKEQTIAQTMEMDRQLREMSPEDRAAEERKMISELNDALGMDIPLDIVEQPTQPEKAPEPAPVEETKPTTKVEGIKQTVERLIAILQSFAEKTGIMAMKDDTKVGISVSEWNDLKDEIAQGISYLHMIKNEKKLLEGLLQTDQTELKDKLEDAVDALRRPVKNIELPDTMGLSEYVDEDGKIVYASETVTIDKISSQVSFKTALKGLKELFDKYKATWALKRLIEKYAPEELKKKKAPSAKKEASTQGRPFARSGRAGGDGGYPAPEDYYGGYPAGGYGSPRAQGRPGAGINTDSGSSKGSSSDKGKSASGRRRGSGRKKDDGKKATDTQKPSTTKGAETGPKPKPLTKKQKESLETRLNKKVKKFKDQVSDIDGAIKGENLSARIQEQADKGMFDSSLRSAMRSLESVEVPHLVKLLNDIDTDLEKLPKEDAQEIDRDLSRVYTRAKGISDFVGLTNNPMIGHQIRRFTEAPQAESKEVADTLSIAQNVGASLGKVEEQLTVLAHAEPTIKEKIVNSIDALDRDIADLKIEDQLKAGDTPQLLSDLKALGRALTGIEADVKSYTQEETTRIADISDQTEKQEAEKRFAESKQQITELLDKRENVKKLKTLSTKSMLGVQSDGQKEAALLQVKLKSIEDTLK